MKLTEIQKLWQKYVEIDMQNIETEYGNISKIYTKFMDINTAISIEINTITDSLSRLKREKLEYYKGWCDKPYHKKVTTASDAIVFIDGDNDIIDLKSKLDQLTVKYKYTERILQQIKDRGFHIQGIVAYRKFIEGG